MIGTDNTLDAAIDAGVKCVICLSTDKAAYPINAMGITKAIEEKIAVAKHRDLLELDIKRLEMLSQYMIELAKTPAFADWNKTKEEVRELLEKYKNDKKINPKKVNKNLKENLGW